MIIRLREDFIDQMVAIEQKSFAVPWTEAMFRSDFEKPSTWVWGWMREDRVTLLGFLIGWLLFEELHIADLAVDLTVRREGIAEGLLDHALAHAVENGAERALLEVRASNQAALGLYNTAGFQTIGTRKNYYRSPTEDAVVLEKWLK